MELEDVRSADLNSWGEMKYRLILDHLFIPAASTPTPPTFSTQRHLRSVDIEYGLAYAL